MFSTTRKIFFADCDPAGVMFFGSVYGIAHSCYEEWAQNAGVADELFQNPHVVFPIGSCSAVYKLSLRPLDVITVRIELTELRESRYSLKFIIAAASGKTAVELETKHFCVEKETGKRRALPENIMVALSGRNRATVSDD